MKAVLQWNSQTGRPRQGTAFMLGMFGNAINSPRRFGVGGWTKGRMCKQKCFITLLSTGSFLQISKACETKLMNIFQLLLSPRRRPAVSSAAAAMATHISIALLQWAGSLARLAPRSPRRGDGEVREGLPRGSSRTPAAQWPLSAKKANIYVLPLFAKVVGTHPVPAGVLGCQAELLASPGERCLGKDGTHEKRGGWEKGKTGDSKITRVFTMCLAEFGWCYGVGTRAKTGNTMVGMMKRLKRGGECKGQRKNERKESGECVCCWLSDYTEIRKANLLEWYQGFFLLKNRGFALLEIRNPNFPYY